MHQRIAGAGVPDAGEPAAQGVRVRFRIAMHSVRGESIFAHERFIIDCIFRVAGADAPPRGLLALLLFALCRAVPSPCGPQVDGRLQNTVVPTTGINILCTRMKFIEIE